MTGSAVKGAFMLIDRIIVHPLSLPFKMAFRHARKRSADAQSLLVEVQAGAITGYGEGAPRAYVTGESLPGACKDVEKIAKHPKFPWEINGVTEIENFTASLGEQRFGNAALCAIEIALIDAFSRASGNRVLDLFSGVHPAATIRYGATVPLSNTERIARFCHMINDWGIDTVRVKLGTDRENNTESLLTVRRICGPDCDLRVDVNGAWDMKNFIAHIPILARTGAWTIEQPLAPFDPNLAEAAAYAEREGVILMADEEACDMAQVERIIREDHYRMINVRLSKCGGIYASLSIIETLRRAAVPFQIGCQLGETGVLSAAGRTLSLLCDDARYHDGSYDAFLLEKNVTREDVSFGFGGKAHALDGPGFGMEVDPARIAELSTGGGPVEITRKSPDRSPT
jgi:L-Ala-D/L-Glu epimerase